jgi:uncharacterized membrane protein
VPRENGMGHLFATIHERQNSRLRRVMPWFGIVLLGLFL